MTYRCAMEKGETFRNTEFFVFEGERVKSINVYFWRELQRRLEAERIIVTEACDESADPQDFSTALSNPPPPRSSSFRRDASKRRDGSHDRIQATLFVLPAIALTVLAMLYAPANGGRAGECGPTVRIADPGIRASFAAGAAPPVGHGRQGLRAARQQFGALTNARHINLSIRTRRRRPMRFMVIVKATKD